MGDKSFAGFGVKGVIHAVNENIPADIKTELETESNARSNPPILPGTSNCVIPKSTSERRVCTDSFTLRVV